MRRLLDVSRAYEPWTAKEIELLHTPLRAKEIARRLQRTTAGVIDKRQRLGLQAYKHWTAEEEQRLRTLQAQGISKTQSATIMQRSRSTIRFHWYGNS